MIPNLLKSTTTTLYIVALLSLSACQNAAFKSPDAASSQTEAFEEDLDSDFVMEVSEVNAGSTLLSEDDQHLVQLSGSAGHPVEGVVIADGTNEVRTGFWSILDFIF